MAYFDRLCAVTTTQAPATQQGLIGLSTITFIYQYTTPLREDHLTQTGI
jgi:hypothetical protein